MNPLLGDKNEPLPYDQVTVASIDDAVEQIIKDTKVMRDKIVAAAEDDVQSHIYKRDQMWESLSDVVCPIYLLKEAHADAALRAAAQAGVEKLDNYSTILGLDEELFDSLKRFSQANVSLSPVEARYLEKAMEAYLDNGFLLDKEGRNQLKEINDKLTSLALNFSCNIAQADNFLILTEDEMKGLPDDFIKSHRLDDGSYRINAKRPDYTTAMEYLDDANVRKRLQSQYYNRALENVSILEDMIAWRNKRAELLGFKTYAESKLKPVMAKTPQVVWDFLNELKDKLQSKAQSDYQALCDVLGKPSIDFWDKSYATNRLKEERFQLDSEEVKSYFPTKQTCEGLFRLIEQLFQVQIKKVSLPVWHEEVDSFEIRDGEKLIGRFFLDFYPRPNKYSHAACFGLVSGMKGHGGYRCPTAALICNFSRPTDEKPSLLTHDHVETLFHEFGHLLHQLLTESPLASFAGTSVARDFVEMPSQIMENWVWEADVLTQISCHYKTGEPIPQDLIDRLLAVRQVNSGLDYQIQTFYSILDMTYHDRFQPGAGMGSTELMRKLMSEVTVFESPEDNHFQASFGHMDGYAAGYYGYVWSRVYADDMFSVFKEKGVFSSEAGQLLRKVILAKGNTEEPMDLIVEFLGRKPKMDAFLDTLGVAN